MLRLTPGMKRDTDGHRARRHGTVCRVRWAATFSLTLLAACSADTGGSADTVVLACGVETDRAELREMETLNLRGCGDIDFRPLWEAENLRELTISDPALTDVHLLAPVRSLEVLRLESSDVSDLTPIGSLQNLRELQVLDTPLTNLAPLARLGKLEVLDVSDTYVLDILPLTDVPTLTTLLAPRVRVRDLSPLNALPELEMAELSENGVVDVRPLLEHPNLSDLNISLIGNCIDTEDPGTAQAVLELESRAGSFALGPQNSGCDDGYYGR